MKVFRYKIYNGESLVLTNWIRAETKEKAIADLQPLLNEYDGTELKVIEVHSANNWSC